MQLHVNASRQYLQPHDSLESQSFAPSQSATVRRRLAAISFRETCLHSLHGLAREVGVGTVLLKDEGQRSSLKSFKALGGAHAVIRLILSQASRALGREITPEELGSDPVREFAGTLTLTCATDGNHGRSVASAATRLGCRSVIYIHEGVSESRANAIRDQGAEVIRVTGNYDDSVAYAARSAAEHGWYIVSDTSWPGYEEIPVWVMQGYLVMVEEALAQAAQLGKTISHIFLQAGVGGYAAAVAAYVRNAGGAAFPRVIVVEPDLAACLYESSVRDESRKIAAAQATIMGMLECYEPSLIAWRILQKDAFAFMTISDRQCLRAMAKLAYPVIGDTPVESGESGAAGVAALLELAGAGRARELLGLDEQSVVLLFNTEAATDEQLYATLLRQALESS